MRNPKILQFDILNPSTGADTGDDMFIDSSDVMAVLDILAGLVSCVQVIVKLDTTNIASFKLSGSSSSVINLCLDDFIELTQVSNSQPIFARIRDITAVYPSGANTVVSIGNGSITCSESEATVTASMLGDIVPV